MIPTQIYEQNLRSLLGPIVPLMDDKSVSEIMINGHSDVFVERAGRIVRADVRFRCDDSVMAALRSIAQYVGRPMDALHPVLEGRLPDGSRIEAVIPPAAPCGPMVSIRRFRAETLTMEMLIESGSVSADAADKLRELVQDERNILVSGGTGSGKTSLLNVLSSFIPADERVAVWPDGVWAIPGNPVVQSPGVGAGVEGS